MICSTCAPCTTMLAVVHCMFSNCATLAHLLYITVSCFGMAVFYSTIIHKQARYTKLHATPPATSLASQTQPTPARIAFRILKAIRAGVGWVWLARLSSNMMTVTLAQLHCYIMVCCKPRVHNSVQVPLDSTPAIWIG